MLQEQDHTKMWNLFREGDELSFKQIYDFFFHPLLNYGLRFTKNIEIAEDAVQDLFTKLWTNRDTIKETGSVKNYLYKSYRRIIITKLESAVPTETLDLVEDGLSFDFQISHDQVHIQKEDLKKMQETLQKALSAMNSRQREILYLRFYEELSYDQIADMMDLTTKSAYKLVYRALDKLKENLGGFSLIMLLGLLKTARFS